MSKDPRAKVYYWLKLEKDFFKRHDVRVLESLDNGKDYLLFYMKLLLESISHRGELRFSETIPYNEKMLSTITGTNIDIVRNAIKVFTELHLMEIWDDNTIYMNELKKMVGSETGFAREQRRVRAIKKEEARQLETMSHNNSISISNSLSNSNSLKEDRKDSVKEKKETKRFVKPTVEEIKEYIKQQNYNLDANYFYDYQEARDWVLSNGKKMKDWKAVIRTWSRNNFNNTKKSIGGKTVFGNGNKEMTEDEKWLKENYKEW